MLTVFAIAWIAPWDGDVRAQGEACLVTTASGVVQGLLRGGTCTYLGVPYAAPPTGELRWRPPQPRGPWAPMTLNTTAPGQNCAQINVANAPAGNEDCLTLNIWAPAIAVRGRGLPVLVWLHTGGFMGASANFPASDGRRFAEERQAIVVAPNYRLGPLGFLAHSALTMQDPTYPSSGNYGLADQRAALRWVRDNIAAFGGDPDNVTLAGTSAGSQSTSLQLLSPATRGLFHRVIMQSGFPTYRLNTIGEAEAQGEAFATALGCTDRATVLSCLRSRTRDQVLQALPLPLPGGFQHFVQVPGRVIWAPSVDGVEIPDQPRELYRRGLFSRMPVIIGTTGDEGWPFVDRSFTGGLDALQYEATVRAEFGIEADAVLRLYPAAVFPTPKDALSRLAGDVEFVCEARRVARALSADGAPVYAYSFQHIIDAVTPGRAFHGLESNLLFGNNFAAPSNHVLTTTDVALFGTMSSYWRQFAETGNPNAPGTPVTWPLFRPLQSSSAVDPALSDGYLVLDRTISETSFLRDSECNFWESLNFRSTLGAIPAAAR